MNKRTIRIYLGLLILLVGGLACRLPTSSTKTIEPKNGMPEQNTSNGETTSQQPLQGSSQTTITLTEAQINSWLNEKLKEQPDQILTNPQLHLNDGMIQLTGQVNQGMLSGEVDIKFQIILDDAGFPKIKVISADLGSMPIPSSILDPMISSIDIKNLISSSGGNFKIQSIDVSEGLLKITGQAQ
jgi:uncharacterized protein YpmS